MEEAFCGALACETVLPAAQHKMGEKNSSAEVKMLVYYIIR